MQTPHVVYGNTVFFKDYENNGFITCKKRKNCMVVVEQLELKASVAPPNISDCCFELLPKLAYSHVQRLAKHEALYKGVSQEKNKSEKLRKLRELARKEKLSNDALVVKMRGSIIALGSTVVLLHTQTNCFVTLQTEGADVDANSLKLALTEHGGKASWFDFMPAFKTSKPGDAIPWGQAVSLRNTKSDSYVHVSNNIPTNLSTSHPYIKEVHEVNGFVRQGAFGIFAFKPPVDDSEHGLTLSSGDIVTMYHADTDAFLVCRDGR